MIKLYIHPNFTGPDKADGGIRRVVEAQIKYLPKFGIQVTPNIDEADVIMNHGASLMEKPGIPMISCNHGLYWHDYDWGSWAHVTNERVVESMARSDAITAPSYWVSNAISRGMLRKPHVVYHGVDCDEFQPDPNPANWVLWNKARTDLVSSDEWLNEIARRMPDVRFVTTFGKERENVKIIGAIPYDEMKKFVAKAGLYLCTARETMGIGTLEALACGVPVVGWDYGGQSEIIIQGETGYLAPFENYDALENAIRTALNERERLSANCRRDALERWQWKDKIEKYADVIKSVYNSHYNNQRPKISVIITSYNLAHFLEDCVDSVLQQTFKEWECLIVDDYSTDNTWEVAELYNPHSNIKYLKTPQNLGLSGARNFGLQHARGKYIIYLDADDMLAPNALELLSNALDKDSSIHIAYGHLDLIDEDGGNQRRNTIRVNGELIDAFPSASGFLWRNQMAHLNQLPYSSMMRREVMENSGGYRTRDSRNEDASFWCRVTSLGYRAKKTTNVSTLIYRLRSSSKSVQERREYKTEPDWVAWYAWGLASNARDGQKLNLKPNSEIATAEIVPFGAQGKPPRSWARYRRFWNVRHHQHPKLSIIIPVGPGHKKYVIDALDSLIAQDFQDWEAVVVNDTGEDWNTIPGAPYAKVLTPKQKSTDAKGAGLARNVGAAYAKGEGLVFLDADDYLLPGALSALWEAWEGNDKNCVVYGDWIATTIPGEEPTYYKAFDFTCNIDNESVFLRRMPHAVTAVYPAWAHDKIDGFNVDMPVWEDWDYCIKMYARLGLCGVRLEQAIIAYRHNTGLRRKVASFTEVGDSERTHVKAANDKMRKFLYNEHKDYYQGRKKMACSKCPDKAKFNKPLADMPADVFQEFVKKNGDGMILQFMLSGIEKMPVLGPATKQTYRMMTDSAGNRFIHNVHPDDVKMLTMKRRKGNPLWVEFNPAPPKQKPQPVVRPTQAAVLPERPQMDSSIWDDVPIKTVEPEVKEHVETFTFRTVNDFNEWLATNPAQDELIAAKLSEQNRDKPRKMIVNGINKALNA